MGEVGDARGAERGAADGGGLFNRTCAVDDDSESDISSKLNVFWRETENTGAFMRKAKPCS